jgi:type I restriction enzyme M protein
LKKQLFATSKRSNKYSSLKVEAKHIRTEIFSHAEFIRYAKSTDNLFGRWKQKNISTLQGIMVGDKPKKIIHQLSEDLLAAFGGRKLIDNYDIYQHLMTYWNDIMQDDVYILVTDGWKAGNEIETDKKKKEWEGRLIPRKIIISQFFPKEKKQLEVLEASRESITREIEELEEYQGGEDGLLSEVLNEKGKPNKALAQKRIKQIEKEDTAEMLSVAAEPAAQYGELEEDEITVLKKWLSLAEDETIANKRLKDAEMALERQVLEQYPKLSNTEIKTLLVENKWMNSLQLEIQNEMDRISHRLAQRIKELAERYETTLPQLAYETEDLVAKVNTHLKKMGFIWK